MVYLLILVVLAGGNAGINQPMRVGHFRSLEGCQAAANEADGIGLDRGSFGFVCVRAVAPSDLAIARDAQRTADDPRLDR
jgi:hypothetical protein